MDLIDYEFTKRKIIEKVIGLYFEGKSTHEIRIITRYEDALINNIIDCYLYLYC